MNWNVIEPYLFAISAISAILLNILRLIVGREEKTDDIKVQSDKLQSMVNNLDELKKFVESQKMRIEEEEVIVNKLKNEKEQLKPLVDADQEIVNALFSIHEKRQKKNIWIDRAMGFFIGIVSSIAASYIFKWVQG